MSTVNGGNVRKGMFVLHHNEPHQVISHEFVSPGKGSAFTRVKLRNVLTSKMMDFTYKTTEQVELAEVETRELQYIYQEGNNFVFMNPRTYDQVEVSGEVMGSDHNFLKEEMICHVQFYNDQPIGIFLPKKVTLEVTEAEEAVAGDRVTAPKKQAKLETGATIAVPIFVKTGDKVVIDTSTGEYVSRNN
jgi:elongation factor P